jgi:hypothetical protein
MSRAPDRLLFKIDVGNAPEAEAWNQVQEYRRRWRRKSILDPVQARLSDEFNPVTLLEDIFMGVRSTSNTDVTPLQGSANTQDVTDLNYYARKFLVETRTPPPVMGFDENNEQGNPYQRNKHLTNQDVRYARHIKKIQKSFATGLLHIVRVHMRLRAANVEDMTFDIDSLDTPLVIRLQPPSFLEELERLEVYQLRMQIANDLMNMGTVAPENVDQYEMTLWVLKNIVKLDDGDIKKIVKKASEEGDGTPGMMGQQQDGGGGQPLGGDDEQDIQQRQQKTKPKSNGQDREEESRFLNGNGGELNDEQIEMLGTMLQRNPLLRRRVAAMAESA